MQLLCPGVKGPVIAKHANQLFIINFVAFWFVGGE